MIAFDTDVLTSIQLGHEPTVKRASAIPLAEQFVPIIAIEEILRGRLNAVRLAESGKRKLDISSSDRVLEPRHYLPLLARKPGLLHNGRPFQGEPFGVDFALLRRELEYRYAADGTKQFLRVLLLLTEHPEADVRAAVAKCVALRAFHADAIETTLRNTPLDLPASRLDLSDRPELAHVGNGIRLAADSDALFKSQRDTDSESDSNSYSQASRRASAPGPEPLVDEPLVDEPVVDESVVDESVVDHRGADAAPLAKNCAPSIDALCCSEMESDPVLFTRKEEAA